MNLRFFMRNFPINLSLKSLLIVLIIFFLMSCSVCEQIASPDVKPISPPYPAYGQLLEENYKGPKVRVVVTKFMDKSSTCQENSQVGEGIAEMLRQAMVATNRYIIQNKKYLDDITRDQNIEDGGRARKENEIDLSIGGVIKEFKQGVAGGGEGGGTSHVTLMLTITNPRTNQVLATETVRGRATDFGGTIGKSGIKLPEVFKDFSKTPMERAIRIAVEDSTSFIVARTPLESYRVSPAEPAPPPREIPKSPSVKVQTEVISPSSLPVIPPPPPLRVTRVVWANVNLRKGPGTNYKIIGHVKKGASLKILEEKGEWLHIRLDDGNEAWIIKLATSEVSHSHPSPPSPKPMPM